MPQNKSPQVNRRDNQQSKLYYAEKMAQHLMLGTYWTRTLTDEEVIELIDRTLDHPSVVARWGHKTARVRFGNRGTSAWSERASGEIYFGKGTCNPFIVIHEVAHLLATSVQEADHGPGFASIYRYLVRSLVSEEAATYLEAAFEALGVKTDDSRIPSVRRGSKKVVSRYDIPGIVTGQAASAAKILRTVRNAGLFDDDPELKAAVNRVARRMDTVEKHMPNSQTHTPRMPDLVTINVASLLKADSRDDVAEIALAAVRNQIRPTNMRPMPLDPKNPPKKPRKVAAARKPKARKVTSRPKRR